MTQTGNGGLDPKQIERFVKRIESLDDDIQRLRDECRAECFDLMTDKKAVLEEAKDAGIPLKPLKAAIKARRLEKQAKAQRDNLRDIDLIDKFDLIRHALGDLADTPLGQAAMNG